LGAGDKDGLNFFVTCGGELSAEVATDPAYTQDSDAIFSHVLFGSGNSGPGVLFSVSAFIDFIDEYIKNIDNSVGKNFATFEIAINSFTIKICPLWKITRSIMQRSTILRRRTNARSQGEL
jgi:hypothetical protein